MHQLTHCRLVHPLIDLRSIKEEPIPDYHLQLVPQVTVLSWVPSDMFELEERLGLCLLADKLINVRPIPS